MERDTFEQQAFAGQPLVGSMVVDAHAHLGDDVAFTLVDTSFAAMVATMDRLGVNVACVSSIPAIYGQSRRGNDEVLAAIAQYPERFFGYTVVDIGYPERTPGERGGERAACWHRVNALRDRDIEAAAS